MDKLATAYQSIFNTYINSNPSSLIGNVKMVKQYFNGDIFTANLPLIYVEYEASDTNVYSGYDEIDAVVNIGYVDMLKNHIGGSNDDIFELKKHVVNVLEWTDDNDDLRADSIMWLIRNNTRIAYNPGSGTINLAVDIVRYVTEYRPITNENWDLEMMEWIAKTQVKIVR